MRLIDADVLSEEIDKLLKSPYAEHREPLTGMQVRKDAIKMVEVLCVEQAPTAYDPDAVVAELEKKAEQCRNLGFVSKQKGHSESADKCYREMCGFLKAIEIVRKGGVHE